MLPFQMARIHKEKHQKLLPSTLTYFVECLGRTGQPWIEAVLRRLDEQSVSFWKFRASASIGCDAR
jgi:hypothetical protein